MATEFEISDYEPETSFVDDQTFMDVTDTCSHIAGTARPSSAMIADGLRYMRTQDENQALGQMGTRL